MKKITALLGFVGVVSMISACSDTISDVDVIIAEQDSSISSDSNAPQGDAPASSSSKKDSGVQAEVKSSGSVVTDTVNKTVYLSSASNYETPYISSGVFCWSEKCEAAAVTSSASMETIVIGVSSEAEVWPNVTETQMVDLRDNKTYALKTIAGVHWMTQNLNYETKANSFCPTKDGADMCAKYGRYYTYAAALSACPTGWRLPTEAEVLALDNAVEHEWWSIGGRVNVEEGNSFGNEGDQGYIWYEDNGTNNSYRIKNYSGDKPHEVQHVGGDTRAYNVRCVENK